MPGIIRVSGQSEAFCRVGLQARGEGVHAAFQPGGEMPLFELRHHRVDDLFRVDIGNVAFKTAPGNDADGVLFLAQEDEQAVIARAVAQLPALENRHAVVKIAHAVQVIDQHDGALHHLRLVQRAQFLVQRCRFGGREHRRLIDDGFFANGELFRRDGLRRPRQKGEQQ